MKAVFVIACAGLFACSAPTETEGERAPNVPRSGVGTPATPTGDEGTTGVEVDQRKLDQRAVEGGAFVCRAGSFCEDFESGALGAQWSEVVKQGDARLDLAGASASTGAGALEVYAANASSSAFLVRADDHGVTDNWSGSFGFAFRANQEPVAQLGGPELTAKTVDGPVSIRISLRPEGLVLEQLAPDSCARERCEPQTTLLAGLQASHWYRVSIRVQANLETVAPYGRIEAFVDGKEAASIDLTVPMFHALPTFRAGITQGDARRALASIDDVSLFVR